MKNSKLKVLIIRFSSMGDIVYTSPVIRCLKTQLENVEIHYLTKPAFKFLLDENPYLDKLHLLKPKLSETIEALKAENFDYVIDLHSSLRSLLVKVRLGVKSSTYQKERFKKWMAIKLKINRVEPSHLVDRYLKTVAFLDIKNDGMPIDYFLPVNVKGIEHILPDQYQKPYVAFIIGANHFTKRMPNKKVITTIQKIKIPVILLGGKDVQLNAGFICDGLEQKIVNLTGIISLNESVIIVKNASYVVGFDTGLTHIAEAFNKKLVTIWGSTIPGLLGVQPYKVDKHLEVSIDLDCRPCSKFGLSACPKGHFKCMNDINEQQIADFINYE